MAASKQRKKVWAGLALMGLPPCSPAAWPPWNHQCTQCTTSNMWAWNTFCKLYLFNPSTKRPCVATYAMVIFRPPKQVPSHTHRVLVALICSTSAATRASAASLLLAPAATAACSSASAPACATRRPSASSRFPCSRASCCDT